MKKLARKSAAFAAAIALPCLAASAASVQYVADLLPLNNSGVSGTANLTLDGNQLTVQITAAGLEANQPHPQHIHGTFSNFSTGTPTDSNVPTLEQDTDGDGFIEVLEGAATYGPILLPLTSPPSLPDMPHDHPMAEDDGTIQFSQTYDVSNDELFFDDLNDLDFEGDDLFPLDFRHIVIHGMSVEAGVGAGTAGEVDGTAGYKAVLPVANGEIRSVGGNGGTPIPLPAGVWAGLWMLGGLGAVRARRRLRGARS